MAQETHTDAEVICTQRITIKHKQWKTEQRNKNKNEKKEL